ncbi:Lrp/AsnC family transcriptional regulator [Microbacterium sp. No. 7]|uniref:Lrp/AsnC family transcriptional regulator n=1 Tax=Microbacterium sp. No. 7 TaxID=1714373 RepID=UPI0006D15E26|nr:Lrp/AsnC family transcriptional regulator [Microbacterium sp. No. 7]ALJ21858.1 hypothetical protein AOA12_18930 [Microbacterium sp. No. 7]
MDEVDRLLVSALQIHPRIAWSRLESIISVEATTLSRRWARLVDAGLAWTSCRLTNSNEARGPIPASVLAFVEIDCEAGRREQVIDVLSRNRFVMSLDCTTGSRELFAGIVMENVGRIDEYLSSEISPVPGVRATRMHVVRRLYKDGTDWRMDALRPRQVHAVEAARGRVHDAPEQPGKLHMEIVRAMGGDVRRSCSDLAAEVGRSVSTVNRAMNQIVHADWARLRVDIAHAHFGYGATAMILYSVPQTQIDQMGAALRRLPEVRLCCALVGRANLGVLLWMRSIEDLHDIEVAASHSFPDATAIDRWMVPRVAKRLGHLIGPDGRRVRYLAEQP